MLGFPKFSNSLKAKAASEKPPLHVIIVGAGKVGTTLCDVLINEGNDVTIIDQDAKKVEEVTGTYDVMGIVGNGASFRIQTDAGIGDTDLLIAVTESDELNLLCCTVAKQAAKCATIARVRTPEYSVESRFLRNQLGLEMIINPEMAAASEIYTMLTMPGALEVTSFAHGFAKLVRVKIVPGSPLIGMTVAEYAQTYDDPMLFCAIERDNVVHIARGDFLFRPDDIVAFVCDYKYNRICLIHMGIESGAVKNALIVGGGKASYYLADSLLKSRIGVKIIEKDEARCDELSEALPDAVVIHGDGTDEALLDEENLKNVDSFIPLTGMDEENIILTLHAKQASQAKLVTKVDRFSFKNVIRSLDLGSVVYPRYLTAEAIIAYARARRASIGKSDIVTLSQMYDQRVECIEFYARNTPGVTSIPIRKLKLKEDLMITFISRGSRVIFPLGDDTIEPGDSVMIVTTQKGFSELSDIII